MSPAIGPSNPAETPRKPEVEQRAFFEAVMARAVSADARARTAEHHLSIAGARIRMLFAGETLQRELMPALAHLCTDPAPRPDATFYVWSSAETGIAMIAPPCPPNCFTDRGDIWGFDSARYRSAFHWSEYALNLMDTQTGVGTFWVQTAENLPYWSKASPLRTLFHWLMAERGCHLLHAAAVGSVEGGILISGKGGVGKSTAAIACLAAGMAYVADDYLVVQPDPVPRAFSLYGTAKLETRQLKHFPSVRNLLVHAPTRDDEKTVLNLALSNECPIASSLPLVAAMTPRFVSQPHTAIAPATASRLVHSAAFTTMAQLPHAGRDTLEFMERLMARLPCYELLLGRDIDKIPAALGAFLSQPRSAGAASHLCPAPERTSDRPIVSVIIPVYNGAHFLQEAVDSILAQGYEPFEIIVVDDGSTDDLRSAVRNLDVDVRLLTQHNLGPASARNLGIRNATGEFIALLDVDDLWPGDTLSTLAERLVDRPDLDVVHGYGQLMRSDGGVREFIGNARESFPYYVGAALYRRRAFEQVGVFDADLRFSEDTDWFTRAREAGLGIERLDRVTLMVRRHGGNMTANKDMQELGALRVFKKALDRKRAHDENRG